MTNGPYRAPSEREPEEPAADPNRSWLLQSWVSRRVCPDCGVHLFAARKEGFRIDACGICGGAWLDHTTWTRAVEERSLMPALLSEQASSLASPRSAVAARECPECQTVLTATEVFDARVTIDVCGDHGAWFDPKEMRAVIEAMVKRNPQPNDPEVDRAIADEARKGALRPRADYELGDRFYTSRYEVDWIGVMMELVNDLFRRR